jgi:hypothetical protein
MTAPVLHVSEALRILTAAGRAAYQKKAPAGYCRTLSYRLDGRPVNIGKIREEALAIAFDKITTF